MRLLGRIRVALWAANLEFGGRNSLQLFIFASHTMDGMTTETCGLVRVPGAEA